MTVAGLSDVVAAAVAEVVRRDASEPVDALPEVDLEPSRFAELGDFSTAVALRLAPLVDLPATQLAARLADVLADDPSVQAARVTGPGFVNVSLRRRPAAEVLGAVLETTAPVDPPETSAAVRLPSGTVTDTALLRGLRAAVVADAVGRLRATVVPAAGNPDPVLDTVGEVVVRGGTGIQAALADVEPAALSFELLRHPARAALTLDTTVLAADSVASPGYAVRYAAARCSALLRNAADLGAVVDLAATQVAFSEHLDGPVVAPLVGLLAAHSEVVRTAAVRSEPHRLARHLERTADAVLTLVSHADVLPRGDEPAQERHRALLLAVRTSDVVLRNGLALLGIPAPVRL